MSKAGFGITIAACAASAAVAAVSPSPVAALAGHYSWHFQNAMVSGETYHSDDVAEIMPVDANHAYVRFALNFYNGHSCGLAGVAEARGETLVYQEPADKALAGEDRCTLTIRRKGAKLTWDDDGTCKAYCGERGSFSSGDMKWSSKRAISYMTRLKGSDAYKQGLVEWHTGHAERP